MTMDVCRICLAGNIKMYSIANTRLKDIYEKLTSNQWSRDRRPVTICYICHSQLNNCFKFWEMSKVSEKIFTQFFACGFEFTEDTVPMLTKRMMQTLSVISVKTLTVGTFSNDETEELKQETPCIEIKAEPGEDSSTPENTEPTENSPHKENINVPRPKEETIEMNTTEHSPPHKNDTISLDINNIPHFYIVKSETEQSEPLISITEDTKKDCAKNTELYTPEDKKELDNEKSSEKNVLIPKYSQCVTLRFKITNRNVNSKPTMLSDTRKRENPFNFHDKSNGFSSNHGKLNKMPYACNYCDKSFIVKYILEKHMRTHTVEKPYACNFCDRTFNIKSYLKLHMKIHTGVKPYACEQCRKTFHQLKHFKQHLRTHAEEKLHVCKLCNKSFNQISNLQQHMRVHTGEKPYACDECDKRFKQMSNLMQHERVHTGENPLNHLKQHLRNNAEEKLHVCKLCNKNFNQLSNLQQHMRVHTGEKPYACDECDKRFKQISNLLQHKRVHTGEKPYGCPTCDKKFAQISNLKQHKIIHTGEKPYSCDNCDKTFNQKSNLLQHIKIFQH